MTTLDMADWNLLLLKELAGNVAREAVIDRLSRSLSKTAQCVVDKCWLKETTRIVKRVRQLIAVSAVPSVHFE